MAAGTAEPRREESRTLFTAHTVTRPCSGVLVLAAAAVVIGPARWAVADAAQARTFAEAQANPNADKATQALSRIDFAVKLCLNIRDCEYQSGFLGDLRSLWVEPGSVNKAFSLEI